MAAKKTTRALGSVPLLAQALAARALAPRAPRTPRAPRGPYVAPGTAAATRIDNLKATAFAVAFWTGTGLLLGGGGYLLWRKVQGDVRENAAQNQSAQPGRGAYYAGRLMAAFENGTGTGLTVWNGTDEQLALDTLREIPTRAVWDDVVRAYNHLTGGRALMEDLQQELTSVWSSEYYLNALAIISAKR